MAKQRDLINQAPFTPAEIDELLASVKGARPYTEIPADSPFLKQHTLIIRLLATVRQLQLERGK